MRLKAYAKINLGLSVTAKRADGFHELDTLFARVSVFDSLRLEPASQGVQLIVTGAKLPTGPANLCYQAAEAYLKLAGVKTGLSISLEKHIPVAAGLGGGSSNAAAVLRGLAELYPSDVDLLKLAADLGSDVPFFVLNIPAAHGQGRGEVLTPAALPAVHVVLANRGVHVSAGEAYRALRSFTSPLHLPDLIASLGTPAPQLMNALEPGVLELYPDITEVLSDLRALGLRGVLMSGSGSTCFGLAASAGEAESAAAALKAKRPAWWVRAASPV